ncbi:MAG: diaminopimelate epimerase [Firmicutes bacterium HGW-Firmicutes-19]|jgi:diaminopimelate epimerase|nr:MAG: diaminopimelate epimerase [Firmicutes bacterium HGW-Firmicutes-19]
MIQFEKYHGTGNDFILIEPQRFDSSMLAKRLCDRHFGIGADGIMIPHPSNIADIKMEYINSDGSPAPMCGNGLRCFVRYCLNHGLLAKGPLTIETMAGIIDVDAQDDAISLNLGLPLLDLDSEYVIDNHEVILEGLTLHTLFLGTLHAVIIVDDTIDIHSLGEKLSYHPRFPQAINVNFVNILDRKTIRVTTHERGAGWTLSCGTGSAASAFITHLLDLTEDDVMVIVSGGTLHVNCKEGVILTGPAVKIASGIFEGEI